MSTEIDDLTALEGTEHQVIDLVTELELRLTKETVFVFGAKSEDVLEQTRPTKRRRVSGKAKAKKKVQLDEDRIYFPTLLSGDENKECVQLRQMLYEETWADVDSRIQTILGDANEKTLNEVSSFLSSNDASDTSDAIPTGLIVTGPNIASQELLFSQLAERAQDETGAIVVTLRSGDASNLKTVLKKLIRDATDEEHEDEDEAVTASKSDGRKLLNYDLQILHNHLKRQSTTKQVVVAFQDSEAFDSSLLTELILLFKSWSDRISFVTLFGIATSVELFQERLSRSAILCLRGVQFDVEQTEKTLDKIFKSIIADPDATLRFGSNFLGALLERQQEHVQSLQAFTAALKYAYMTHFYANPLTIFLTPPEEVEKRLLPIIQPEHKEALRMLPSFRTEVEQSLQNNDAARVRSLMEDNDGVEGIVEYACGEIEVVKKQLAADLKRLDVLHAAMVSINSGSVLEPVQLYLKYMSGELHDSDIVKDMMNTIKRYTPSDLCTFMTAIDDAFGNWSDVPEDPVFGLTKESVEVRLGEVGFWIRGVQDREMYHEKTVRSIYSQQAKVRTQVVGQKVQLSKEANGYSADDIEYTKHIDDLVELLKLYFNFDTPLTFPHEIFVYDAKSPYKEVFTPRPRHAIERALSAPHDYLGCSCCADSGGLSSSQPPTAILYQLYLESGGLINVFDLWSAFRTIVNGDEREDEADDRVALMLFYQALADLKLMGAVKPSRKKTDHISKLMWKGL